MPNPFRVNFFFVDSIPGLSLPSNPGLQLANAFGVKPERLSLLLRCQALIDGFDPAVGFDEACAPGFPVVRKALALDLVQGLAGRDLSAHDFRGLLKHAMVALEIVER